MGERRDDCGMRHIVAREIGAFRDAQCVGRDQGCLDGSQPVIYVGHVNDRLV